MPPRPAAVAAAEPSAPARAWLWATAALTACGFAAAVVFAPPPGGAPDRGLGWLLFTGSSVHVAATGWLYTLADVRGYAARRPVRFYVAPAMLVAAGAATAAVLSPAQFRWLLLPFFGWQFFHFQKQNVGMSALAAKSSGLPPLRKAERGALIVAGLAGIGGLIAHPALLQVDIPKFAGALFLACGLALAAAICVGLASLLARGRANLTAGYCVVYLMSLCFPVPVFCFTSPYAAVGGMTIAHGLQYLLLVGLVAAGAGRRRTVRLMALCDIALAGGVSLAAASHLHDAAPVVFGLYLGTVMAHFVVDAALWRMRDPFPRAFLAAHVPYLVRPVHRQPI